MRQTSSQTIYDSIKDDIIYLRRKPGEELNIKLLSEELEVSRSPVRDALMLLQNEGLVDMLPQRGCWVSQIDLKRVEEERVLRFALERCVLERFSEALKNSEVARIEYFIELQKESLINKDSQGFYSSDDDMHHVYFALAGLDNLWKLWIRETGNYRRIRLLSFDALGSAESNIGQHVSLLEALKSGDFECALDIIKKHTMKVNYEKDAIIQKHPEYFVR